MNIFEAMFKGNGKATLPDFPRRDYCHFLDGCFVWKEFKTPTDSISGRASNTSLARNDWQPYTEEKKNVMEIMNEKEAIEWCVENQAIVKFVSLSAIPKDANPRVEVRIVGGVAERYTFTEAIQAIEEKKACNHKIEFNQKHGKS